MDKQSSSTGLLQVDQLPPARDIGVEVTKSHPLSLETVEDEEMTVLIASPAEKVFEDEEGVTPAHECSMSPEGRDADVQEKVGELC